MNKTDSNDAVKYALFEPSFYQQDADGSGPVWILILPEGELHQTRKGAHVVRYHSVEYLEEIASEAMRALKHWQDMAERHGQANPYRIPLHVEHQQDGVTWGTCDYVAVLKLNGRRGLWARVHPVPIVRLAILMGHMPRWSPHIKHEFIDEYGEKFSPFLREISFTSTPLIKSLGSMVDYINATVQAAITLVVMWTTNKGKAMNEKDIAEVVKVIEGVLKPIIERLGTVEQTVNAINESMATQANDNKEGDDKDDPEDPEDDTKAGDAANDDVKAGDKPDDLAANDNGQANTFTPWAEQAVKELQHRLAVVEKATANLQASDQQVGNPGLPPTTASPFKSVQEYVAHQVAQGMSQQEAVRKSMTDPLCPRQ